MVKDAMQKYGCAVGIEGGAAHRFWGKPNVCQHKGCADVRAAAIPRLGPELPEESDLRVFC
jgi:hypothetical protein